MGDLHREPGAEERRQDGLDVCQSGRPRRAPFLEHASGPWVAEHHLPGRYGLLAQRGLPVLAGEGALDLAHDQLDDAIEQVVLAPDMPVHGHRVDAELLTELTHAQRLDAIAIGEADGSPEHTLPGQGRARLGACSCSNCHLTSVRSLDMFTA